VLSITEVQKKKMAKGLQNLADKEYPGRIIIIGRDITGKNDVVVYAITGRSPSSQARKMELEDDAIWTKPTDDETLKRGNIDLLVYPAIILSRGIAVSNGKQTADIKTCLGQSQNPAEVLELALRRWEYELDAPIFTPRISGCILPGKKAALSLIKRAPNGSSIRNIFEITLKAGKGKMISTYEGENKDPLTAFRAEPIDVEIKEKKADDMAEAVYDALQPAPGEKDYRVAVASVFSSNLNSKEYEIYIINKHERMRREDG
jgi:IMP cyclohydrolase